MIKAYNAYGQILTVSPHKKLDKQRVFVYTIPDRLLALLNPATS